MDPETLQFQFMHTHPRRREGKKKFKVLAASNSGEERKIAAALAKILTLD